MKIRIAVIAFIGVNGHLHKSVHTQYVIAKTKEHHWCLPEADLLEKERFDDAAARILLDETQTWLPNYKFDYFAHEVEPDGIITIFMTTVGWDSALPPSPRKEWPAFIREVHDIHRQRGDIGLVNKGLVHVEKYRDAVIQAYLKYFVKTK